MSVSAEEIQWSYRLLLGREPESARVIQEREGMADRLQLVKSFLDSTEFQKKLPDFARAYTALDRLDGAPLPVDVAVSPAQLAALSQRVKACWTG